MGSSKIKPQATSWFALACLLLLGSVWGSTIVITKHVVSTGNQALGLIFWQLLLGAVLLSFVARLKRAPLPLTMVTVVQLNTIFRKIGAYQYSLRR